MNSEPVPPRSTEVRVLGKDSLTLLVGLIWEHLNEDQRRVLEGLGLKSAGVEPPRAPGERRSWHTPNDVKIEVAVRGKGRCVECGATEDLHFEHKIPYSAGGANTVRNIQLMCGAVQSAQGRGRP